MGRSVRVAGNPGRTKERRIESFAGQQAPRPERAKEKPARLRRCRRPAARGRGILAREWPASNFRDDPAARSAAAPLGFDQLQSTVSVDEFSAEFAADPPRQPASTARVWQQNRELVGNLEIFGDHPHSSFGHVNDRAVTRQGADPELDLRHPLVGSTFASASICQHVICPKPGCRFNRRSGHFTEEIFAPA
jgi:hypothetical protein